MSALAAPSRRAAHPRGTALATQERRELKFLFPSADVASLRDVLATNLRPVRFGEHASSQVNSIYFDDEHLSAFVESRDGTPKRWKSRIRWYDEALASQRCVFELKERRGLEVRKQRVAFELDLPLAALPYDRLVPALLEGLGDDVAARFAARSLPTILVSYTREHFVDSGTGIRATLDYGVAGYDQRGAPSPVRRFGSRIEDLVILEVKVDAADQGSVRGMLFPLTPRVARCSKYVRCCLADGVAGAQRLHD